MTGCGAKEKELVEAAMGACKSLYGRSLHDIDAKGILATESHIMLGKMALESKDIIVVDHTEISISNKLFLFEIIVVADSSASNLQPFCHDDERSALMKFKNSFVIDKHASFYEGAYPKVLSWKFEGENTSCCSWDGIQCDEDTGHVIGLDLSSSFLYGSINSNSTLFSLIHLQALNLADNHFNYSHIPPAIKQLSGLTYLNLTNSMFSGQVPFEISNLSKLSTLDLSYNSDPVTGIKFLKLKNPDLRTLVRNLTSLEILRLSYADISSTIPDFLANFFSLTSLRLVNCELYGEFPTKIFQLPNLQILNVGWNENLTGYFPAIHQKTPLTKLILAYTRFYGSLPSSIEKLDSLEVLNVKECNFSGIIPSSLGKLGRLTDLHLGMNNFSGYIPSSLHNLTQLTLLYVSFNQITGPIPPSLGNLTKLTELELSRNQLHGPFPESLSKLKNLENINLAANNLVGIVRFNMFFNMKNLTELQLSSNNFSVVFEKTNINETSPKFRLLGLSSCNLYEFPAFLRHQNELEFLELSGNKIYGQIPKWMWKTSVDTLISLSISDNFITGFHQRPAVLPWVNLDTLRLSSNMLQGPLPIPPPSIKEYNISGNMMTGKIPHVFCNMSSLYILDLSDNKLDGMIPQCFRNLSSSLFVLSLRNNSFHGIIPQTCSGSASNLMLIDLSYNQLQGQIPRSLSNCMMLEGIVVSNNRLNDVFPSWLGSLPKLKLLTLRKNEFYGAIGKPEKDLEFPKLQVIDLSCNNFSGELPSQYIFSWNSMKVINSSDLAYMIAEFTIPTSEGFTFKVDHRYSITISSKGVEMYYGPIQDIYAFVDLSSNRFEGKIPELFGNLKALRSLNLSNNMLSGHIPSSLGDLTMLESLDLSQNNLSGDIPQQLKQLGFLARFNVSHNNLTGPIPKGKQFYSFDNSSFEGNPGLCGDPLSRKCGDLQFSPTPTSTFGQVHDSEFLFILDWKFAVAGFMSGLVVGVVLGNTMITRRQGWLEKMLSRISRWR
nr:receptor-like protein 7 [Ziziphus jujuba var. spinosa]